MNNLSQKVRHIYRKQPNGSLLPHPKQGELKDLIVDYMQDDWKEWKGQRLEIEDVDPANTTKHKIEDSILTRTPGNGLNFVDFVVIDLP